MSASATSGKRLTKRQFFELICEKADAGELPANSDKLRYGEKCLYRGPDGLRCPVGLLITDQVYSPELEGKTVVGLPHWLVEKILPDGMTDQDLSDVQMEHDSWSLEQGESLKEAFQNLECFKEFQEEKGDVHSGPV